MNLNAAKTIIGIDERLDREPRLSYLPNELYEPITRNKSSLFNLMRFYGRYSRPQKSKANATPQEQEEACSKDALKNAKDEEVQLEAELDD